MKKLAKYFLNRLLEKLSIVGYIGLLFGWLANHGIVLTQVQMDTVQNAILWILSALLVFLPDNILLWIPKKIVDELKGTEPKK